MIILIIILMMLAVFLCIALVVSLRSNRPDPLDNRYRDEDGDHLYYNESIIVKKEYRRKYPDVDTRTFERLFRRNTKKKYYRKCPK